MRHQAVALSPVRKHIKLLRGERYERQVTGQRRTFLSDTSCEICVYNKLEAVPAPENPRPASNVTSLNKVSNACDAKHVELRQRVISHDSNSIQTAREEHAASVCVSCTPVQYAQTVRLSCNRKGNEWPGQGGGCGERVQVHGYAVSKQSG